MSEDIPIGLLFGLLGVLLVLSACFSGSETALMSINRYRLKHKARDGHRGAILAEKLLADPERLIGLILLGNNAVNILAASITTIICLRLGGEKALAIGTFILTLCVLIFAEVAPKTLAALKPERIALPAAYIYYPLLRVLYPIVWLTNQLANLVLKMFGLGRGSSNDQALSREELRTVVNEASALISRNYRRMLTGILDLDKVTVDDVMIPHNEIMGIDLEDDIDTIIATIHSTEHTRLPVYRDSIDNVLGILHFRRLAQAIPERSLSKDVITSLLTEPYFVPEGTPLSTQLLQFQRGKRRIAMVVDEYGDIQGMTTLEDILEEIVGEFTTDPGDDEDEIRELGDGQFLVDGGVNIRELNRLQGWDLPIDGPKTLNGLIVEHLETIPAAGTDLVLAGFEVRVMETADNMVTLARVTPPAQSAGFEHTATARQLSE